MQRIIAKISLIAVTIVMATMYFPVAVSATSPAILITPTILNLSIDPGKSATASVKIINSSVTDREFHLKLRSFNTGNNDGQPVLDDSIITPLHDWFQPSVTTIDAPAKQQVTFTFTVNVPAAAKPGSYRTAILFSDDASHIASNTSGPSISAEVGPLLFVRVNGNADEQIAISSFSAHQTINEDLPIQFDINLDNSGNVDLSPVGTINIVPQLAVDTAKYSINFNPNGGMVLAASTRKLASEWVNADGWHIGFYQAQVVMAYGQTNKVLTATSDFWVLPWKAVAIFAILTAVIMAYMWNRRLAITRKKQL